MRRAFGQGALSAGRGRLAAGRSLAKLSLELGERFGEPFGVRVEPVVRDLDGLPAGELLQALGKLSGLWHRRPVDKNRYDRNVTLERRLDLDADEVVGVVEAAPVLLVGARNPALADDSQQRVAFADPVGEDVDEIAAGRDRVHVEKDVLVTEFGSSADRRSARRIRRNRPVDS